MHGQTLSYAFVPPALLLCLVLAGCGGLRNEATALGLARPAVAEAPASQSPGESYAAGVAAESAGAYEAAERHYIAAATAGSDPARLALGTMYLAGRGVQKDYAEALHWLEPAGRAGNAEAQVRLGLIYEIGGSGITRDGDKALGWYERAAAQGLAIAQYRAGALQLQSILGRENPPRAMVLFRQAAAQNHAEAQTAIGILYLQGRGVRQDLREALAWLRRGAAGNDPEAMLQIGRLYWSGEGVARNIPEGTRWLQRAAELGSEEARHELALPPQ